MKNMSHGKIVDNFLNMMLLDFHQGIKALFHGAILILKFIPAAVREQQADTLYICRTE